MARTQVTGLQILDGSIKRDDLDIATNGQAVVRRIIAGTNINISSTGVDTGTGDVTINATTGGTTFLDGSFRVQNTADNSKQLAFDVSSVTAGNTRTLVVPDANGSLALVADTRRNALIWG